MSLTLRDIKGTELTWEELDTNFTYLENLTENTLSDILSNGNITGTNNIVISDGQTIDAENGLVQLDLRYGGDDMILISTDAANWDSSSIYMEPGYVEIESIDPSNVSNSVLRLAAGGSSIRIGQGIRLTGIGTTTPETILATDADGNIVDGNALGGWEKGSDGSFSIKAKNDTTIDATGDYAYAEGFQTTASGESSHAEGSSTTASGNWSHAEGARTTASGDYSHAGGQGFGPNRVNADGQTSFAHFRIDSALGNLGTYADFSAILGGTNHNILALANSSAIIGGEGNEIEATGLRSVILGGSDITATAADMVYLPNLTMHNVPTYADNAAAVAGGLDVNTVYKTATGELRIVI